MYATKSFCGVMAFAHNQPGENSAIGELTTRAATFSRDLANYHHPTIDGYDLVNFYSRNDDVKEVMTPTSISQAIALVDLCVRTTLSTSGEIFQDEILRALVQLAETINVVEVTTGPMVHDGDKWVPSWISWIDNSDARTNSHTVWLAVDDFLAQYPDYEIAVVSPVDNLDSFFDPGSMVETMIRAITPTQMMERDEVAQNGYPTSWRRSDAYEYQDPLNPSRKFDVYWHILGWGDAGNDPDLIREKMVEWILANSTHSRDDWAVIFPDIFKRTELVFTPVFDRYAAETRTFDYGIYSPIVNSGDTAVYAAKGAPEYPLAHVQANSQGFGFPYRSLFIACIGHIENRDGKFKLSDFFPDYINAPFSSTDAGRMSPETQGWVQKMLELVLLAESWTTATRMPRGIYRLTRNGKTYISATYNRVLMVVLVKSSL